MIHERFVFIHGSNVLGKCHIAARRIDAQSTAIQLETRLILDIDCAACRFNNTFRLTLLRTAKESSTIGTGSQGAATRSDVSIDVDTAFIVAIRICIQDNIQRARCIDIRIDIDVTLRFQSKGIAPCCRLIDLQCRIQCDISIAVISIYGLNLNIVTLQYIDNRRRLDVRCAVSILIIFTLNFGTSRIIDNNIRRVKQPFTGFARLACGVNVCFVADFEVVARRFNQTAVNISLGKEICAILDVGLCADSLDRACTLPGLHAGCIKRAVQLDNAVIAAVQKDLTLLVLTQGLCFHRARVVDDRAHDIAGTPCRHDEIAAICLERTDVERLCLSKCTVNGEVDLACRIGGQAEVTRCCKSRRTLGIRDRAAVLDFCRMQHDEATLCADRTGVDDLSRRILGNRHRDAVCIRKVRHIAVADPRRRSDERTNVNTGVLAEQHAVGVDDIDMSVARERAIDDGCSIADHAVQCYRVFVRLTEGHTLVVRDVKARPVDCQAFGILVDRHVLVLTRDLALTGTDDFTLRHRIRNTADRHRHHRSGNRCGLALPSLSSSHRSFHFGSPLFVFNA